MENKEIIIITAILFVIMIITVIPQEEINLDNLTFNETKLNELKYNINVNCKWLIENDYEISINQSKMSEICLGIFPDLMKEAKDEK